jgi:ABC-type uncharacterized transport system fused permease/ATPase subunit
MAAVITFAIYITISYSTFPVGKSTDYVVTHFLAMSSMHNFISTFPGFASSLACMSRLQTFLKGDVIPDRSADQHTTLLNTDCSVSDTIIYVKNGCMSTELCRGKTLANINVLVRKHSMTIINGPSGSGKTLLLLGFSKRGC